MSNNTFKFSATNYTVQAGQGGGLQLSASAPADPIELSNQLQLPDGSASEPSLTNKGDLNTGLYFPAQESVAIVGDGQTLATFDGVTGKVTLAGLVYPSTDGTAGQVLTTDGNGNLTFASPASGGGSGGVDETTAISFSMIFGD